MAVGVWLAAALASSSCSEPAPPLQVDGGLPALEASPPSQVPSAAQRNAWSAQVVFDWVRGGVWTANGDAGSISYVDIDARRVVREVRLSGDVRTIALSPDAKWIIAGDRQGGTVTLVDAETATPVRTLPVGARPRAVVWDAADPRWAYVALEGDDAVAVVDRTAGVLAGTIGVGRLPSGLAVSRVRHELYVTHRIDARMTVVDLNARGVLADVSISNQASSSPSKPNGTPFAFEGLALTIDGLQAWIPHELLAPKHPFVFTQTLFPAISVVDALARTELQDERMNLFDAVNLLDATGQPMVFSQFCAVAPHPNGMVAYALACASEDFLTFDAQANRATDVIRNLPGDHPVGLALDDTGQRALVLFDQSHTLVTIDTAGGDPIGHARVYGDPIPLIAHDPVDPELRAGLTLFFRANSTKGSLATTGNDWMSCGGCHLDGFGSSNALFFDALVPSAPTVDGRIGHTGLRDLFSTASAFATPTFSPHDVLTALLEQGGLAPDRLGASRSGQVDPSAPTPDAALMAERIARVIARDQPVGPSWLGFPSGESASPFDGVFCARCHPQEYTAWAQGAHAHSAEDPMVVYAVGVEQQARGAAYSAACAGCHDPTSARMGDTTFKSPRGVTCLGCHDVERATKAGGNGDLSTRNHDWMADHEAWGTASLALLRKPEFCGGCHEEFVPGTGVRIMRTVEEYAASPVSATKGCVDCHMPKASGISDHRVLGANVPIAERYGDAAFAGAQRALLATSLTLTPAREPGGVQVSVANAAMGHGFPAGVSDLREPWVEVQALDAQKNVLARFGAPGADGVLAPSAARLNFDVAAADGTVLLHHDLSEVTHIPFNQRVPPTGSRVVFVPLPSSGLPAGTAELDAILYYRSLRTTYWRAATGDPTGTAPAIEVARAVVP